MAAFPAPSVGPGLVWVQACPCSPSVTAHGKWVETVSLPCDFTPCPPYSHRVLLIHPRSVFLSVSITMSSLAGASFTSSSPSSTLFPGASAPSPGMARWLVRMGEVHLGGNSSWGGGAAGHWKPPMSSSIGGWGHWRLGSLLGTWIGWRRRHWVLWVQVPCPHGDVSSGQTSPGHAFRQVLSPWLGFDACSRTQSLGL